MNSFFYTCTYCQQNYPPETLNPRCIRCNEPLQVNKITQGKISNGLWKNETILERYRHFIPLKNINNQLSLKEGFTPLVKSIKIAEKIGINQLYFKNESINPTWSFKDRGTQVAIQHALYLKYDKIGTVSTGNMAVSVAAYGARNGLLTFILVTDTIPPEKLNPISIYNPVLIKVKGDYDTLYYSSLEIGKKSGIYFMNSDVPFRVEGSKTISFEICEQLKFKSPDFVVVPTSSGGNFRGILKGFEEFKTTGLIDRVPRMICAQASGCSPIYNAFINNKEIVNRVHNPETIAHAIKNPYPPSGNEVLRQLRKYNGIATAVSEEEILKAQLEMASEGLFGQPAAAVPLAAVNRLREKEIINDNHSVVCILSGSGLKYTEVLDKHPLKSHECPIENLGDFIKQKCQ